MCFFLLWPLSMLTEQLVLTTIRQEPSEQQDPDLGSTMCARFTDRFDKSEFAQSGLTPHTYMSAVQCACGSALEERAAASTPGPQEPQLSTRY